MKSIALLLCLGAARAADLDGDGATDAAAADTCCALKYGNALSECSSATDLAGTASCCPAGFLHRYSIGSDGNEDTTKWDCISFMSQTDCAAYSWSAPWGTETPIWMSLQCPHFLPTPAPTPAPQLTPPPTPKGFRDNDQDGVDDAAADGTCCAFTYGNAFAGCSGATDLAGAAGCCPSDFLLRHSIQAYGEDTTSYDCVSFRSETDCAAYSWSGLTPTWVAAPNCPHTTSSVSVVDAAAPRAVGLLALVALLFSA